MKTGSNLALTKFESIALICPLFIIRQLDLILSYKSRTDDSSNMKKRDTLKEFKSIIRPSYFLHSSFWTKRVRKRENYFLGRDEKAHWIMKYRIKIAEKIEKKLKRIPKKDKVGMRCRKRGDKGSQRAH